MSSGVDVAIVGAGQAGLATSWYLTQANVDHVVLEAGRIAETWRTRRWDSFCLVTPNWAVKLPGIEYSGGDPDGFMTLAELIAFFEGWAASFKPPVQGGCHVSSLEAGPDGKFALTESGFMDRTPDKLPSPAARLVGNPQATGHGGGRDLHYRTLHAEGVELLGRFAGAEGSAIHFADDLAASVDFGDARWADVMGF